MDKIWKHYRSRLLKKMGDSALLKILDVFHPVCYDVGLTRMGREVDGGYVVPAEIFTEKPRMLSFGISDDTSFEEDVLKKLGVEEIFCFDPTIEALPKPMVGLKFHKIGLAGKDNSEKRLCTLEKCYAMCDVKPSEKVVLKIDIEGWEWDAFDAVDFSKYNINCLILELHFFHEITKEVMRRNYPSFLKRRHKTLLKVLEHFHIAYFHANNNDYKQFQNYQFPEFMEVTLISKKFLADLSKRKFSEFDKVNAPQKPDYQYPFLGNFHP